MTSSITQADRSSWQCRAAAELARILDRHPDLPRLTWTVGPVGSVVVGRVSGLAPAEMVRQVFGAWRHALGLEKYREFRGGGGTAWLRASARSSEVTIRLTATVLSDDEDGQ